MGDNNIALRPYFEQSGFYQRGAEQAGYPLGFPGFAAAANYGQQRGPESPFADPAAAAACKLYPSASDVSAAANAYKVDCSKESNGYGGGKDLSAWPVSAAAVAGAARFPGLTTSGMDPTRDRHSAASLWQAAAQQSAVAQQSAQLSAQQGAQQPAQYASTPIYPWMAMAGEFQPQRPC